MHSAGYSLIELLVVISIISIFALVSFINFKNFSNDQITTKAVEQVKDLMRLAQSNSTAGVPCPPLSGPNWGVTFNLNQTSLDLVCGSPSSSQKTLNLENAKIQSLQCSPSSSVCPPTGSTFIPPLTVNYAALFGNVNFSGTSETCINSASTMMVVVRNTKNNVDKCFTLSKGGAIDVQ